MARSPQSRAGALVRQLDAAQADRERARESVFGGVFDREPFDFAGIDAAGLADGLAHQLGSGNAVTLSLTADGGAVKVTVWVGGKKSVAYAATTELFDAIFAALGPPLQSTDASRGT